MMRLTKKAATSASAVTHFIVETADGLRKLSKAGLTGMFPTIARGKVGINTTSTNKTGTADISLSGFDGAPYVAVTVADSTPANCSVSVKSVLSTGFTIVLTRTESTDDKTTVVHWIAMR